MTWEIRWAIIRCHWWSLWHLACSAKATIRYNDEPVQVQAVAAVTSDWRVLRVFYERSPGLAEERFGQFRDGVYI